MPKYVDDKLKELVDAFGLHCVNESLQSINTIRQAERYSKNLLVGTPAICTGDEFRRDSLDYFYPGEISVCSYNNKESVKPLDFIIPFENVFTKSKLKNYLFLNVPKLEKYKPLDDEDMSILFDDTIDEDKNEEIANKPYNIFRKRYKLPAIDLEIGAVYFVQLGKKNNTRIVKMRLQRIKNEDSHFPELYFSLEDLRTLKHNHTHMNIGIFKIINKVVQDVQN